MNHKKENGQVLLETIILSMGACLVWIGISYYCQCLFPAEWFEFDSLRPNPEEPIKFHIMWFSHQKGAEYVGHSM